ncbi:MAG: xanthine dehydrogenase accessory protein XdhC [Ornithinimicrobium sp.]|uniref:xanthine dehydrogenase accessory protein XdhC n=1 Tax=Ornithinimicrobium sp. TaxID=1977084 RepID=UPI0026E09332|nr:xanthine dehydrogenase accessory protein XdhC [Ornithinimicrobium sp.]MDO5739664.1 xanthine dehydrogenase accessory protein XdhC [Ornithinimicrobium sp.]
MLWLRAVEMLRSQRQPGVLVTVTAVRGHSPRHAGAKMVVGEHDTWDSVGGGNLEMVAIQRARALLAQDAPAPVTISSQLSDKAPYEHGVQCCGGVVTMLLEPLHVTPVVAIFGMGHVGHELARILARHDLDLHLVDTRPEQLAEAMMGPYADADARIHSHQMPVLPELVLGGLPAGTHILVMTHDHAEDYAIVDAALRTEGLGSIGLIGSSAKWSRFRSRLLREGGFDLEALERVRTPIGLPTVTSKEPAAIAVGVAADLLGTFAHQRLSAAHSG